MTTRFAINPPDEDRDAVNPEHEADQIRQQAWDVFVASLRDYAHAYSWATVFRCAVDAYDCSKHDWRALEIREFSEGYGWPDTLVAISTAMRADEAAKKEAMDRR